jgi:hypothetical protein
LPSRPEEEPALLSSSLMTTRSLTRPLRSAALPITEVLEYCPYEDGYLQLELRRYVRRDGSSRERGPYWYFQYHEGGKRKKLYLGKTSDPESMLTVKRSKPSGG